MLGERDYTVFAGHFHRYVKNVRQDRKFITLATTGGGSSLRGSIYGEFDHVAWVTMTSEGPRIANLMLDGIHDENVVTSASQQAIMSLVGAGVRGGPFVRSLPVFDDGPMFERGLASFEATNAGSAELTLAFNVDPRPAPALRRRAVNADAGAGRRAAHRPAHRRGTARAVRGLGARARRVGGAHRSRR